MLFLFLLALSLFSTFSSPLYTNLHIVMLTYCSHGDLNPYLAIASELKLYNHRISLICSMELVESLKQRIKQIGVDVYAEVPANLDIFESIYNGSSGTNGIQHSERSYVEGLYPTFIGVHNHLLRLIEIDRPDFILANMGISPIADLVRKSKIPALAIMLQPPLSMNIFAPTPMAGASLPYTLYEKLQTAYHTITLFGNFAIRVNHEMEKIRTSLGYFETYENLYDYWRGYPKIFAMVPGFSLESKYNANYYLVGHFIPRQFEPLNLELQHWLDDHLQVIFVTFGTTGRPSNQQLKIILEGLLSIKDVSILVAVHQASFLDPKDNDENKSRVKIVNWVPQIAVLNHSSVKTVVTHCGSGGISETLYFGKPFLGLPFFFDQFDNARNAVRFGVALSINGNNITTQDIQAKVSQLLFNETFNRRALLLSRWMKQAGGVRTIVNVMENTILDPEAVKFLEVGEFGLSSQEIGVLSLSILGILVFIGFLTCKCCCCQKKKVVKEKMG